VFGSFQFLHCVVFCLCEIQNHILFKYVLVNVPNKVKKSVSYAHHVCLSECKPFGERLYSSLKLLTSSNCRC
jgi:hypothetical protein